MDPVRIRSVFGDPDLAWLVDRLRRRLEQGSPLGGTVTLVGPTSGQRRAMARLLGRPAGRGDRLRVALPELAAHLRDAEVAPDLRTAVEVLAGPLADLVSARADEAQRRAAVMEALGRSAAAGSGWYERWAAAVAADGTLTRLVRRGEGRLAEQAAAILGLLPADDVPLPVLAERVTGDTKALSGTALASLVLRALAVRAGRPLADQAHGRRALWESAGVVLDDLSSQVLVLNVVGREQHAVGAWLRDAATLGIPFRLTLHQLSAAPVTPVGQDLFVCENPAVLRVAAAELGARSAPLVCTEGQPSVACQRLVEAAARNGARVHWRGDFDWTGLRTTAAAVARHGAVPWRMSAGDYRTALSDGDSEPLKGPSAASAWDGDALAAQMLDQERAVMEERIIPVLLQDLGSRRA